jgi:hypothetical protein
VRPQRRALPGRAPSPGRAPAAPAACQRAAHQPPAALPARCDHPRSKGWLPRSGLLYGADFVLYQLHPAVVHSDYAAMLVPLQGRARMELSWQETQIANRLISQVGARAGCAAAAARCAPCGSVRNRRLPRPPQVGKRLVLLYIHSDVPLEGEVCSSPACLEHVTAEERMMARWVPDATRD